MSVTVTGAKRLLSFVLLSVAMFIATGRAAGEIFGDIEIRPLATPKVDSGSGSTSAEIESGYVERRFLVSNLSLSREHQVRLIMPGYFYRTSGDYVDRNSRSVSLAPGSSAIVSILRPPLVAGDGSLAVEIDDSRQDGGVQAPGTLSYSSRLYRHRSDSEIPQVVLASKEARQTHLGTAAIYCRSELPVDQWSPNWLGYSCYHCVLLTRREASMLPPEVALALRRYAEAGGIVLIQGDKTSDAAKPLPASLRSSQDKLNSRGQNGAGFGVIGAPSPGALLPPVRKEPVPPTNVDLQVVRKVDVPVRGLLLLVTFFAIGIGPVNIWLLARTQRRMWLWWIVPGVSIATCMVVLGYSLLVEGITNRVRTVALTILDEENHRATTVGYISCYCPLTPSGGLHFSYDTEVTPLLALEDEFSPFPRRYGTARTMDWTNDQHLQAGWVASRVPAMFAVRKNETSRRERLTVRTAADGKVTVVNGLGVKIASLYYMDDKHRIHTGHELGAGQATALSAGETLDKPGSLELRKVWQDDWSVSLPAMRGSPASYLQPGHYVALIERNPFLEDGLTHARHEGSWGIVYGISARSGDGR